MQDDEKTCGQELAENADVPERWGRLMAHVASNLDAHAAWVGDGSPEAAGEQAAMRRVAEAYRAIAEASERAASVMRSYSDLPPASHDPEKQDPAAFGAWMRAKVTMQRDFAKLLLAHAHTSEAALAGMEKKREGTAKRSLSHASSEEAIIEARAAKAARVRARGENPFANDLGGEELVDLDALRARFAAALAEGEKYDAARVDELSAGKAVHVAGRIVAARSFGKAAFLRLRDRTGQLQLFFKSDLLGDSFARLDDIDVADFVDVTGVPMVTKTGELSLEVRSFRLLTKALRPLPEKWHGLTDVEIRYRQRYVDLVANPDVKDVFRARSLIIAELRRYLDGLGFVEVETPSMHTLIGGAAATPFVTHHNALDMELFMRIAPELYLKRLVVGGFERVYEIARCYRNEGISTRHNPEFTMVEFYRAYATYQTLMDMTEDMLRRIDARLAAEMPKEHARWLQDRPFTLAEPFARVPMRRAVEQGLERAGLSMSVLDAIGQKDAPPPIKEWAARSPRAKAIDWSNFRKAAAACGSAGETLFCAYEYVVEAFLAEDYRSKAGDKSLPVFITDYPYEVSPLARKKDADPTLVDRFELFVHGRELCNAFSELNDPVDQAARFRAQVEKKARGHEETMDYDEDYVRALEHGMPPAAGFGMGIDRLAMMLASQPSIRDVILFPLLRPEKSGRESAGAGKTDKS